MLVVLGLALVAVTYAAPPIVPVDFAPCVDGVNNVIQMADVNDGTSDVITTRFLYGVSRVFR